MLSVVRDIPVDSEAYVVTSLRFVDSVFEDTPVIGFARVFIKMSVRML